MANLLRRIEKLETRLMAAGGPVRDSEEWFAYWEDIIERYVDGQQPAFQGRIPLAVVDRLIERADRADGLLR